MKRWLGAVPLALACIAHAPSAKASSDPRLLFRTFETPHFRVTFYSGSEEVARHTADLAEGMYAEMSADLGWAPQERTEIMLTDFTDSANGSATALPFNTVRLFMTAPDDMSPLADVDDWMLDLVTHEYTHILHTDQIRGLPALANRVFGKTFAPNQVQPRWLLEGLAVYHESKHTSAGRMRSSIWDMFMRADVLENNMATLDQMSNFVRRWPQGNIWYLYGSYFLSFIAETYGDQALRAMIRDYGERVVPWGINRSVRRATGRTFEELYPAWIASMQKRYQAQRDAVRAQGMREGVRLSTHGQAAGRPRFVHPKSGLGNPGDVIYFADDGRDRQGYYTLGIERDARGHVVGSKAGSRALALRINGDTYGGFAPDGSFVFQQTAVSNQVFAYNDLFRMKAGTTSQTGFSDPTERLSYGVRAHEPDPSPDGRTVVFVSNHRGTRYLQLGEVQEGEGPSLGKIRSLVPSERTDQAYTPRFSPDGTHVAYSVFRRGGYRDIRYVDVRTGTFEEIAHDRAQDGAPSFSADGKYVLFHSDRTGIPNVYAWEIESKKLFQVTNVIMGAFQPELSADGRTLLYVGYTKAGFDLFAMDFDPARFTPAPAFVDTRPPEPPMPAHHAGVAKPYEAWRTLVPRKYSLESAPGNFGQAYSISVGGTDIAGLHSVVAALRVEAEQPEPQGSLAYSYSRLPFDVTAGAYRVLSPRDGYGFGAKNVPAVQETMAASTAIGIPLPQAFENQSVSLSYTFGRTAGSQPTPVAALDPYETPRVPFRGYVGSAQFSYSYDSTERYLHSVGGERGQSLSTTFALTDPILASDFAGFAASADYTRYFRMPFRQHTFAFHAGLGTSSGTFPGRGSYYVGGFVDLPPADVLRNLILQGGFVLRGYPTYAIAGPNYMLGNFEYRFPIVNIDRGLSTLPLLINRINGAVFADYGTAFDAPRDMLFKLGSGAELQTEWSLGYYVSFFVRLGAAHGFHSGAMDRLYLVAAVPY